MTELALLVLAAAVATTFALDVLRPLWKLMTRRSAPTARVDGHEIEAHAVR